MVVASAMAATNVPTAAHSTMPRGVSVAKRRLRLPLVSRWPWLPKPKPYAGTGGTNIR